MTVDCEKLWKDALAEIELNISQANFATWFKDTCVSGLGEDIVYLNVPSSFVRDWMLTKYHKFILRAVRNLHPNIRSIEYCIASQPAQTKRAEDKIKQNIFNSKEQMGFNEFYVDKEANLNPKYTFESFVVGSFNNVAHAAAMAVTKNPGTIYNPLFIYGGTGLGKTHLIQAIGNKIKEENQNFKAYYLTSEKFANEFINSLQNKDTYAFKEKYRKYNLLIVDDIQFFANKLKIQEEFFYVFNTLYEKNNQIVFSSDKPPRYIPGLEERLRSRFEGGMMVDISPPEFEARLAILRNKAEAKGFLVSDDVLELIASSVQENIRELEGALVLIAGQSRIKGRILNAQEVKDILKKNAKPIKTLTVAQVIKTVADFYNINEKDLFEKTRKKEVVKPRQIAMYLMREDLNLSYPYVGQKFGQMDHTTIIYAYRKISDNIKKDEKINQEIINIRNILYDRTNLTSY